MSHPQPSFDPENVYPDDSYKPVQKKHQKKSDMAKKMFDFHGSQMNVLLKAIAQSKKKKGHPWFKSGQGGGGLPPGRTDRDNQ